MTTQQLLETVNQFKKEINIASTKSKNEALEAMAIALLEDTDAILKANALDLEKAKGHITDVMLDRLRLDESRIQAMAEGIRQVAQLPDPVGEVIEETVGAQNIEIKKKRVPFGVIGEWKCGCIKRWEGSISKCFCDCDSLEKRISKNKYFSRMYSISQ